MEPHFKFKSNEQRIFLQKIASKSGLKNKQLAEVANISSRNYRDWLRERLCISQFAANKLSSSFKVQLPENEKILLDRWRVFKHRNSVIGGYGHFRKYGSPGTLEGRRKGWKNSIKTLRSLGLFTEGKTFNKPDHSIELAEYIGIMLGDGSITTWQCNISLNGEADKDYIVYVSDLGRKLFYETPKVYKDKNSKAIRLYYNGIKLVEFLLEMGLNTGDKVKQQVCVPYWIENSITYRKYCVRGLMDTDGCVYLHKHITKGVEYNHCGICFSNRSRPLVRFVSNILNDNKIKNSIQSNGVYIYSLKSMKRYFQIIGSSNPRNFLKFEKYLSMSGR